VLVFNPPIDLYFFYNIHAMTARIIATVVAIPNRTPKAIATPELVPLLLPC
jgi:hypothetical protein